MSESSGGDHVVVAANAASTAQHLLAQVRRANMLLAQAAPLTATLADPRSWDGSGAQRFRATAGTLLTTAQAAGRALERAAADALKAIQAIDAADATHGVAVSALDAGDATLAGFTPPPVTGWPGKFIVNEKGAFQNDTAPDYGDDAILRRATPLVVDGESTYAETIAALSEIDPGSDAARFFQHYLDGTGTDLRFDSTVPYRASQTFQALVNMDAQKAITAAQASGKDSFDTGYVYSYQPFEGNGNWTGAVGGSFHRLVGHRTARGTWETTLQITSYYQFRPDHNFGPKQAPYLANGAILHELEREGIARDYHSIGTGTLSYDSNGKPLNTAA